LGSERREEVESVDRRFSCARRSPSKPLSFSSHLDEQLQVHVVRLGRRAVLGFVAPSGFEVDTLQEWRRRSKEGKEKVSRRRQKGVSKAVDRREQARRLRERASLLRCALSPSICRRSRSRRALWSRSEEGKRAHEADEAGEEVKEPMERFGGQRRRPAAA